ncbi:MAG: hypothetical protein SFU53_07425 [Terrimicrobiaceae bacterium]|nr:hypothetical protein [Terrimicrobiaceae bacterium]
MNRTEHDPIDAVLAERLREFMPPPGLRGRLMALRPQTERHPVWRWAGWVLAGLAAVAVVVVAIVPRESPADAMRSEIRRFLDTDFEHDLSGRPLAELQEWLAQKGAPVIREIPPALAAIPPEGCRVLEWRGHRAALICFYTDTGSVHLVAFPPGTFDGLKSMPQIVPSGDWLVAGWTGRDADVFLFGYEGEENLRKFL